MEMRSFTYTDADDLGARVKAYDPIANNACREQRPDLKIRLCDTALELASESDALVLVTEWKPFRYPDFDAMKKAMKRPIVFDGRNQYDPKQLAADGFEYFGIGRDQLARSDAAFSVSSAMRLSILSG